jgi:hypothetical protein
MNAEPQSVRQRLEGLVERARALLGDLDASAVHERPAPGKWSQIEILGHLVDSAVNNHLRFVRANAEGTTRIEKYAQDEWVTAQDHQGADWPMLLSFWDAYNRHLARVIGALPEALWMSELSYDGEPPITVEFLAVDYVDHQEHHLAQILPGSVIGAATR